MLTNAGTASKYKLLKSCSTKIINQLLRLTFPAILVCIQAYSTSSTCKQHTSIDLSQNKALKVWQHMLTFPVKLQANSANCKIHMFMNVSRPISLHIHSMQNPENMLAAAIVLQKHESMQMLLNMNVDCSSTLNQKKVYMCSF